MKNEVQIRIGVPANQTEIATVLFSQAFQAKFTPFLGPAARTAGFLSTSMVKDRAFVALLGGKIVGIAGFKLDGRGLFNPTFKQFFKEYGFSAPLRILGLLMLERPEEAGSLLMDGIAVSSAMRGKGIGTKLLNAITGHARSLDKTSIRLDVIDTNNSARRLYERLGFREVKKTDIGPLRTMFSFRSTTQMQKPV